MPSLQLTTNSSAPENGWLLEDELSKLPIPSSLYGLYSPTGFRTSGGNSAYVQGTQQDSQQDEGCGGSHRGLDRFQLAQRPSMPTAGMVPGGAMPGAMPGVGGEVVKS